MSELEGEAGALLRRWAATPGKPVSELTLAAVRAAGSSVLDMQRDPGELHSVEDVEVTGSAGVLPVRVYRSSPGPLDPVLFLHGVG